MLNNQTIAPINKTLTNGFPPNTSITSLGSLGAAKEAYDKFQNHGLVKTDSSGKAVLTLNCPQPYSVDGITYPRHVHYCLLKKDNFWSDDIKTVIVSCDVDFKTMKKFVHDKCHLIVNALAKESYDRCKIPGSINIPLSSFNK